MKRGLLAGVIVFASGCGPDGVGVTGDEEATGLDETTGFDETTGLDETDSEPDHAEIETALAIADLDTIVAASIAYFEEPHPSDDLPPHRCPDLDWGEGGWDLLEAGTTPHHSVDCWRASDGLCIPVVGNFSDTIKGEYPMSWWSTNLVWFKLDFMKTEPHAFHYNIVIDNEINGGYGSCSFTASAYADLDDDHTFSTYERRATVDEHGAQIEALFISNAGE